MGESTHQRPGQAASAALLKQHQNTTTASQIESLARLHGTRQLSLIEHANQLIADMKGLLPESGIEHGVLHQLPGKTCNGVLATSILVSDINATFIDLSTGVVVTVDDIGRRRTSLIGGAR